MNQVDVVAHPNVALVKYWGKRDELEKIPASPSLSITLGGLETRTSVTEASADTVVINGKTIADQKILQWLGWVRHQYDIPRLKIDSSNNFPTNCGFASSSSGFAAMAVGINELCRLDLNLVSLARVTRFGSASAVRSLLSGYVTMHPDTEECAPVQLVAPEYWELSVVAAVTSTEPKPTSSTSGMARTVATSPFFEKWVDSTSDDFERCKQAIHRRNFDLLAEISEANCYRMHALMMSTDPPLRYWSAGTMNAIDTIERLRHDRVPVFFTSDAGPQIKAICPPEVLPTVRRALEDTDGVLSTLESDIGNAPTLSAS
ncbi:MAG: diphosphomevalonate decarboxylase [Gammaproteobacteria bacterium]|nr:diphosphomevalonate decarboxylase [Gammaproteobacteria bacterium]MYF37494.1 diphosphomevalonate decarboxylase [Gammaproteobacteria bacterium]